MMQDMMHFSSFSTRKLMVKILNGFSRFDSLIKTQGKLRDESRALSKKSVRESIETQKNILF